MIVVDTQLLVYLTTVGPNQPTAKEVLRLDPDWITVPLWRSEFRNAMAGYVRRGELDVDAALTALQHANATLLSEIEPRSERVMELVAISKCSAYDLEFVALAEELGVTLVTNDREILAAFPQSAVSPAAFIA